MPVDEPQSSQPSPTSVTPAPNAVPSSPEAVTDRASATVDRPPVPLAPLPRPLHAGPDEDTRLARLDIIFVGLALLFAFFLAAREVRQTDVFMYLASGRDLLSGKYNPISGTDPYSSTTAGARW